MLQLYHFWQCLIFSNPPFSSVCSQSIQLLSTIISDKLSFRICPHKIEHQSSFLRVFGNIAQQKSLVNLKCWRAPAISIWQRSRFVLDESIFYRYSPGNIYIFRILTSGGQNSDKLLNKNINTGTCEKLA